MFKKNAFAAHKTGSCAPIYRRAVFLLGRKTFFVKPKENKTNRVYFKTENTTAKREHTLHVTEWRHSGSAVIY